MGWSRLYGMSSQTKHKDAAWRLMYFMGGKDANGRYDVGQGLVPEIRRRLIRSSRSNRIRTSSPRRKRRATTSISSGSKLATAQIRENILTTWYAEWDRFTQQQIQNVLLRQIKPAEAMAASAKKAQDLKKSA